MNEKEHNVGIGNVSPQDLEAMKSNILNLIKRKPGASFVELCRDVPGFDGPLGWQQQENCLLWTRVSDAGILALQDLIRTDKIVPHVAPLWIYMVDGCALRFPLAKNIRPFKTTHWLPLVFSLPRGQKKGKGVSK